MGTIEFLNSLHTSCFERVDNKSYTTIEDFFSNSIKSNLPSVETIIGWHSILMKYIEEPDAIFFIRRYGSDKDYSKLRRGTYTECSDGTRFVFCDNYFAHFFFSMAIQNFVPDYDDFKRTIYEMRFPFGLRDTKEERTIKALPLGKDPGLNNAGWKLAHLYDVNRFYFGVDYNAVKTEVFPRGEREDWDTESNIPTRKLDKTFSTQEKDIMKGHFLRLVHPMNYFLVPKQKLESDLYGGNIGESKLLIEYVKDVQSKRMSDIFREFEIKSMAFPREFDLVSLLGGVRIDMEVLNKKVTSPKINIDNTIKKTEPAMNNNIIATEQRSITEIVDLYKETWGLNFTNVNGRSKIYIDIEKSIGLHFIESKKRQPNDANWFDISEYNLEELRSVKNSFLILLIKGKGEFLIPLNKEVHAKNNGLILNKLLLDDNKSERPAGEKIVYRWACYFFDNYFTIPQRGEFFVNKNNLDQLSLFL